MSLFALLLKQVGKKQEESSCLSQQALVRSLLPSISPFLPPTPLPQLLPPLSPSLFLLVGYSNILFF